MSPEAVDYFSQARTVLAEARQIRAANIPRIAAGEAYLAAFLAAEGLIFERTGKVAKTHRGLHSEFARLARNEPSIDRDLAAFLGQAFSLKLTADYGVGATGGTIAPSQADEAIARASRFIETIAALLPGDAS